MTTHTSLHTLIFAGEEGDAAGLEPIVLSLFPASRFARCSAISAALAALDRTSFDVAILYLRRLDAEHEQLLERLREHQNSIPVVVLAMPEAKAALER